MEIRQSEMKKINMGNNFIYAFSKSDSSSENGPDSLRIEKIDGRAFFSALFPSQGKKILENSVRDKIRSVGGSVLEKVEYNRDLDRAASLEFNGKPALKNSRVELKSATFVKLSFFLGLINIFELESAEERQVFKELLDLFWKIPPRLFFILFLQFYSIVTIQTI